MKKILILAVITSLFYSLPFSFAQEQANPEKIPVLRQAKQDGKTTAAIDACLIGDILEIKVTAMMYASKPEIANIILVGPKIGRISPEVRKTVVSSTEEEAPYPTTKRTAFISFGDKAKTGKARSAVTRELVQFKIPVDKIMPDRLYQIWVKIEDWQGGGEVHGFKFDLEGFPQLVLKEK